MPWKRSLFFSQRYVLVHLLTLTLSHSLFVIFLYFLLISGMTRKRRNRGPCSQTMADHLISMSASRCSLMKHCASVMNGMCWRKRKCPLGTTTTTLSLWNVCCYLGVTVCTCGVLMFFGGEGCLLSSPFLTPSSTVPSPHACQNFLTVPSSPPSSQFPPHPLLHSSLLSPLSPHLIPCSSLLSFFHSSFLSPHSPHPLPYSSFLSPHSPHPLPYSSFLSPHSPHPLPLLFSQFLPLTPFPTSPSSQFLPLTHSPHPLPLLSSQFLPLTPFPTSSSSQFPPYTPFLTLLYSQFLLLTPSPTSLFCSSLLLALSPHPLPHSYLLTPFLAVPFLSPPSSQFPPLTPFPTSPSSQFPPVIPFPTAAPPQRPCPPGATKPVAMYME